MSNLVEIHTGPVATYSGELDRVVVPRLRALATVLAVMTTALGTILLLVGRGAIPDPGIGHPSRAVLVAMFAGACAMVAVTYAPVRPRTVVVVGLGFQIYTALCTAAFEQTLGGVRGASLVCLWILNFALVPTTPRRAKTAAYGAASAIPIVLGVRACFGLAPDSFDIIRAVMTFAVATIAVITARMIYGLNVAIANAKKLGAYQLVEKLGEGGMGEVWRAEHETLARPAAIKLMRHEADGDRATLATRFRREVEATAALTSPHTVAVYDFGQTSGGELYYVMELLHGLDLERLVTTYGPQPAERVVHILRQACDSLAEAHRRSLVHRDIKPANMYLCAIGTEVDFVKMLDFGLVRGRETGNRLTNEGWVSGTPAYMAPETAARNLSDARSDVYALGCVAYWLLTGALVFDATTAAGMMAAQIHEQPAPPSYRTELHVPAELEAIVMACLAKDPCDRPRDAAALAAALPVDRWSQRTAETWWRTHVPGTLSRAWS